jgi:raffinose/stachyose/melibiose transport system substrate-binding protein
MVPPSSTSSPVTTGGESLAFALTSKSKHADVAAAYLNFITNQHADDVMTNTGNLAAVSSPASQNLTAASPEGQMVAGWSKLSNADGLVPYLDYSTPTFYDTLTNNLQDLIGGRTTPQKFTAALQQDYSSFLSAR